MIFFFPCKKDAGCDFFQHGQLAPKFRLKKTASVLQ